jgi:hypothetical protein
MHFAVFHLPQLIRMGGSRSSELQSRLGGLSIEVTGFRAIGQIAVTVLFPQMHFALSQWLPRICSSRLSALGLSHVEWVLIISSGFRSGE